MNINAFSGLSQERVGVKIIYVLPFFLGEKETHKPENARKIPRQSRDNPGTVPRQSRLIYVLEALVGVSSLLFGRHLGCATPLDL